MAKKTKSPAAKATPAPSNLDGETSKKIVELKTEGNNSFARGDYGKALTIYEDAIKLLPAGAAERADFHNNKAACFIGQKRYKEAVKECTSALEVSPNSVRALQRRAKAYEQQGLYAKALADVSAINKTDLASPETQEQERRLREAAARRPTPGAAGLGGSGLGARGGAGASSAAANKLAQLQQGVFVAKCSLGDDTKLVHLNVTQSYADVLAAVQAKFPNAGPFALKYLDKAGDLVTITCRNDIHVAVGELAAAYQRQMAAAGQHGPKLAAAFPPLKLVCAPVASAADVPPPPPEEELERQQLLAMQQARMAAAAGKDAAAAAPGEEVHLDSWLVDFAHLFVQTTGLEPDKHVELQNLGWDSVTKGLESTIAAEAAVPLFDKAKDSFRDVTCTGLTSWGQVHQFLGQRALDAAGKAGKTAVEAAPAALAEYAEAEKRYREALSYNPEFFDAVCNMGQLEFERCKLAAGLLPVPPATEAKPEGEAAAASPSKTQDEVAQEQQEAAAAATRAALALLQGDTVSGAEGKFRAALEWVDKAVALAPAMDAKQEAVKPAEGQAAPAQGEYGFKAQALVLKGNFIYEWSQMLAAVGQDWRPQLDAGVALFREAGCPEKDIRVALRNHLKAPELDIPAEEAEAAAAAPAPAKEEPKPAEEEKPKAKGLPSLEVKKAKK
ncbi:hypothetical protein HYH03_004243 [Edaphochlamys debaryana]|uniref:PB1 domain-containing protein n=1 Tax=Edaphochlamys debaryana TaxID=47281 RepID=A0A835YA71_9CHLO|nr:hypothetical protein HYH03_004243 [Edaphochlamys debaryana]|eukprot:KAG2497984.1 hypothetical protein HYH03_004243 [Edaphochlamys debaryana]